MGLEMKVNDMQYRGQGLRVKTWGLIKLGVMYNIGARARLIME